MSAFGGLVWKLVIGNWKFRTMPVEKSAGAVVFKKNKQIEYLILNYPSTVRGAKKSYWDFPKGHIEKGETAEQTAQREVLEETGIKDIALISGFKEHIKYFFRHKNKIIFKIVTFFLAEAKSRKVKISSEHIGYLWLPYEKAIRKLTFKNSKLVLKKANNFLLARNEAKN